MLHGIFSLASQVSRHPKTHLLRCRNSWTDGVRAIFAIRLLFSHRVGALAARGIHLDRTVRPGLIL